MVLISNLSEKHKIVFAQIKLVGTKSNRDALGATVTVKAEGKIMTRFNDGKSGYLSQSSMPLYFGLGGAKEVDSVEITWPSGKRQILKEILLNRLTTITEER
jgi:enediyne biosynthesis protein E4